jgi:aspartyl/asparaginyl-tRNA synthetase
VHKLVIPEPTTLVWLVKEICQKLVVLTMEKLSLMTKLYRKLIMQNLYFYNQIIRQCRDYFQTQLGFYEVPAQPRLSILAACEDPSTITTCSINQTTYPLPQTGQMWLEVELLKNPSLPGVFCITTSYRDEKNPRPGRHDRVFPMFEFEAAGTMDDLRNIELGLLRHLGFNKPELVDYEALCEYYQTAELTADHELMMQQEFGNALSLERFPERTHPFWNMMKGTDGRYNKIDVILHGMETIGSAEREVCPEKMRKRFFEISNGGYSELLFKHFGKERVLAELEEYLALPFFQRFGGGIGVTRLARAMQLEGLMWDMPEVLQPILACA